MISRTAYLTGTRLAHADVYRAVGIDPAEGRRAARSNPHHLAMLKRAGGRVVSYLDGLGLIGGPGLALWRRSGLL